MSKTPVCVTEGSGKLYCMRQIGELLRVTTNTVKRWIKNGHLKGFCLPPHKGNYGQWRVLREDLIEFMNARHISLSLLDDDPNTFKTLTIGLSPDFFLKVRNELDEGFLFAKTPNLFRMGMEMHVRDYQVFIIHTAIGRSDSLLIAREIRSNPKHDRCLIFGVTAEGEATMLDFLKAGFNHVWENHVTPTIISQELKRLALKGRLPIQVSPRN